MTSSVNGKKFNTPQWNLNDEVKECGGSEGPGGPRIKDRTAIFCEDVTILGDLVVEGNVTINGTLKVAGEITAPFFNGLAKEAVKLA